jgi:hypothetical protein
MAKSSRLAVKVVSGGMVLSAGNLTYSIISAVGSIARLLGPADYGVKRNKWSFVVLKSLSHRRAQFASLKKFGGYYIGCWAIRRP